MAVKQSKQEAQNPLILRCHRIMEAFAKSDDERDFYLDRIEGFIIYADLDKSEEELKALEAELTKNNSRYCMVPKLTFYETKKIMEGFVNEKVYDIDTKEKLLDIIQSKEARENFLEFLYDHHAELEKWQQYYQERSRVRIIEWLRQNNFYFVFEEDLDLGKSVIEKLKKHLFDSKAGKDVVNARKALITKAKTYYSNEALNPRPKRGRPPKQAAKTEIEPQLTDDIYTTVAPPVRPFLFKPDMSGASAITFSSKFESEDKLSSLRRHSYATDAEATMESLNQKLASLRSISSRWLAMEAEKDEVPKPQPVFENLEVEIDDVIDEDVIEEEAEEEEDLAVVLPIKKESRKTNNFRNGRLAEVPTPESTSKSKKTASTQRKLPLTVNKRKPTIVKTLTKPLAKPHAKKKATAKKAAVKKSPAKKAVKKPAAKKAVKKPAAKKTAAKKPAKKAAKK